MESKVTKEVNKAKLYSYLRKDNKKFFDKNYNFFNKIVAKTMADFHIDTKNNLCAIYLASTNLTLKELKEKFSMEITKLTHSVKRNNIYASLTKDKVDIKKINKSLIEILLVKHISMIEYSIKFGEERVFNALIKSYNNLLKLKIDGHIKDVWDVLEFYCEETNFKEVREHYSSFNYSSFT